MVKRIIAINGKAGAGKNTVADLIKDHLYSTLSLESKVFAFADPIKNIVLEMFPKTDPGDLWGASERRSKVIPGAFDEDGNLLTYRKLLLDLGKKGRNYNKDIWINATLENISTYLSSTNNSIAIITDLRFTNEFLKLKETDCFFIKIVRPNNQTKVEDISETDLDHLPDSSFDSVINNFSDLQRLGLDVGHTLNCYLRD